MDHPSQQEDHWKETHPSMRIDLQSDDGHHPVHLQDLLIEEVAEEKEIKQEEESHHPLRVHPHLKVLLIRREVKKVVTHEEPTEGVYVLNGHGKERKNSKKEERMLLFLPTTAPMDKWIRYLTLFNNLMPLLVESISQSHPSFAICLCIFKNLLANGGQV